MNSAKQLRLLKFGGTSVGSAEFYGYESDIHDGWEDEQVHDDPPQNRELAFKMGVNIFVFGMAQAVAR